MRVPNAARTHRFLIAAACSPGSAHHQNEHGEEEKVGEPEGGGRKVGLGVGQCPWGQGPGGLGVVAIP